MSLNVCHDNFYTFIHWLADIPQTTTIIIIKITQKKK